MLCDRRDELDSVHNTYKLYRMNPDKKTLEALARVRRAEPVFTEWLESRYGEYCKNIANTEGPQLHWLQGRMQELTQIIDVMDKAAKLP